MKVKFERGRLSMLPETRDGERFCKRLIQRMTDSNLLMGWYGDVRFNGKETSGYVVTTKPSIRKAGREKSEKKV